MLIGSAPSRLSRLKHVGSSVRGEERDERQRPVPHAGHAPAEAIVGRLIWRGESIEVPAGESVMGRDRGCAIRIDADSVSRHHARLHASGCEASIEDLGSKNGTWVDGQRIRGAMPLTDGMSFRLGSETIRFELTSDERPTKTVLP